MNFFENGARNRSFIVSQARLVQLEANDPAMDKSEISPYASHLRPPTLTDKA